MKNKKAIVICSVIAAVVLIAGIAAGVITASHNKAKEPETTQANSDIGAVNQSTASSETTQTQQKKHYAPKNIELIGNEYNIVWSKDDKLSLRIENKYKESDLESEYDYFDIKLNEYGELVKAQMYVYDNVKKTATPTERYSIDELTYNDKHQLVGYKSIIDADEEYRSELAETYTYNSDGYRIKNECKRLYANGESATFYTEYTYENGLLKELYVPVCGETTINDKVIKLDRLDVFYYDLNDLNLPSKMYIAADRLPEEKAKASDDSIVYSYEYDEVSQAQEKFYYNTLIYLITDENASLHW